MARAVCNITINIVRSTLLGACKQPGSLVCVQWCHSSVMGDILKPREISIKKKLTETFKPAVLQIVNESYMHSVPKGSETHFKVVIVSQTFEGVPLVQRHRNVNTALEEEFAGGLHALSIVAKTPAQWETCSHTIEKSPPCRGGAGL